MDEQEVVREALTHYINHLEKARNGFYDDYAVGAQNLTRVVLSNKIHAAEMLLKDSYMPHRMLQVA
jgi:hypothetical protein